MKIKAMIRLIVVVIFFITAYAICSLTPYYIPTVKYEKDEIRLVIDDNEYTRNAPNEVKIVDDKIMLSLETIVKYFDKYAYFDEKYNTVIIASGEYVVKMPIDNKIITINKENKVIQVPVQEIDEVIYVPIEELADIYEISVEFNEKVIITTKNAKFYTVVVDKKIHTKKYKRELCLTTEVVSKKEELEIFNTNFNELPDDEYVWVRTNEGSFGYVKKSNIKIKEMISEPRVIEKNKTMPKINLTWEYAENYTPDRSMEEKIDGLDIVSPTWIYVKNTSGDVKENVSDDYIRWAISRGYDVWPTIKNDGMGIENTSILLNDMHARQVFVDNIIEICKKYNFKGINLDFEHMYKKDSTVYAQLVRELSSTLRVNGIISSVDVNVPDGSDDWSLCFDSKAISDAVDYIIVMAYDQYGVSSSIAGPVASLDWVELNINKLIEREEIDNKKLVLAVPFYSRFWRERNNSVISTTALTMSKAKEYMEKNKNSVEWSDEAGQYIIRYNEKNDLISIFVEDENSLRKKVELVNKYDLAGVASWRRGQETKEVWDVIYEVLER